MVIVREHSDRLEFGGQERFEDDDGVFHAHRLKPVPLLLFAQPCVCGEVSDHETILARMFIECRRLTQAAAAAVLEIDQPKVSALTRGRLSGFSLDRLVKFLVLLGSDVKIVVKPRSSGTGQARLMIA